MPRIKIEKTINVYGVDEIQTKEYNLPDTIISPKTQNLLHWDSYHHTYLSYQDEDYLSAEEYIQLVQEKNKKQKNKAKGLDDVDNHGLNT